MVASAAVPPHLVDTGWARSSSVLEVRTHLPDSFTMHGDDDTPVVGPDQRSVTPDAGGDAGGRITVSIPTGGRSSSLGSIDDEASETTDYEHVASISTTGTGAGPITRSMPVSPSASSDADPWQRPPSRTSVSAPGGESYSPSSPSDVKVYRRASGSGGGGGVSGDGGGGGRATSPQHYTVQSMSMDSVLNHRSPGGPREPRKQLVPMKPLRAPLVATTVSVSGGAGGLKPMAMTELDWADHVQAVAGASICNSRMPASKPQLSGRNALTRQQELEWKLSDALPALADNRAVLERARERARMQQWEQEQATAAAAAAAAVPAFEGGFEEVGGVSRFARERGG